MPSLLITYLEAGPQCGRGEIWGGKHVFLHRGCGTELNSSAQEIP